MILIENFRGITMFSGFGLWESQPFDADQTNHPFGIEDDETYSPFTNRRPPLQQSAPAFLQNSHEHKVVEANKQLIGFACKILKYFGIISSTNSPQKMNPKERRAQRSVDLKTVYEKVSTPFNAGRPNEFQELHFENNRHYSLLLDTGRLLKIKVDTLDLNDFIHFTKNWGIQFDTDERYNALKKSSVVDLIVFMYIVKRYPGLKHQHIEIFEKLIKSKNQIDHLVEQEGEFVKFAPPLELYEMDFPSSFNNSEEEMNKPFTPKLI